MKHRRFADSGASVTGCAALVFTALSVDPAAIALQFATVFSNGGRVFGNFILTRHGNLSII